MSNFGLRDINFFREESHNNNKTIEAFCDQNGDGSKDCPYVGDCNYVEIIGNNNRRVGQIECLNQCDYQTKTVFPLDKIPGTTKDKAQIGLDNRYYIASKPVELKFGACPAGYTRGENGECCNAGWSADCDANCFKKRCEDLGMVWNEFPEAEMAWNRYQCCPAGACPWSAKRVGVGEMGCVGNINNNPNRTPGSSIPNEPIYSAARSRAQCLKMGKNNWSLTDNGTKFQCDNNPVDPNISKCDYKTPGNCIFKDYNLNPNNVNECAASGRPQTVNLNELGKFNQNQFKDWLKNTYDSNYGSINGDKSDASNVYEYVQRCKNVSGFEYLQDLRLADPNSVEGRKQLECSWKSRDKCVFRDYKISGDQCNVNGAQGYSVSGLAGYSDGEFVSWLQDLYAKDEGPNKTTSAAPNVRDYLQRCNSNNTNTNLNNFKNIGPNNECAIMFGPFIKNVGLVDNIALLPNGRRVYLKFDDNFTKMVSEDGQCRYYSGMTVATFDPKQWNNYTVVPNGSYQVRFGSGTECSREPPPPPIITFREIITNNECAIMFGPGISVTGLCDNIGILSNGQKVYIKTDTGLTKMVHQDRTNRWTDLAINKLNGTAWNSYNVVSSLYNVRFGVGNECLPPQPERKIVSIGTNNECAIMSGPAINNPGLADNIAILTDGKKVYMKNDSGLVKMVHENGQNKYLPGSISNIQINNDWNTFFDAQSGDYTVRKGSGNECSRVVPIENLSPCIISAVEVPGWKQLPNSSICIAPAGQKCCNIDLYNNQQVCNANFANYGALNVRQWMQDCIPQAAPPPPTEIKFNMFTPNNDCAIMFGPFIKSSKLADSIGILSNDDSKVYIINEDGYVKMVHSVTKEGRYYQGSWNDFMNSPRNWSNLASVGVGNYNYRIGSGTECGAPIVVSQAPPSSITPIDKLYSCYVATVEVPGWKQVPGSATKCIAPAGQRCCNNDTWNNQQVCSADFVGYDNIAMNTWKNACVNPAAPPPPPAITPIENLNTCNVAGVQIPGWKQIPGSSTKCIAPAGQRCCNLDTYNNQQVCSADFVNYDNWSMTQWKNGCINQPVTYSIQDDNFRRTTKNCVSDAAYPNFWIPNSYNAQCQQWMPQDYPDLVDPTNSSIWNHDGYNKGNCAPWWDYLWCKRFRCRDSNGNLADRSKCGR